MEQRHKGINQHCVINNKKNYIKKKYIHTYTSLGQQVTNYRLIRISKGREEVSDKERERENF